MGTTALIVIDMLSPYTHEDVELLEESAGKAHIHRDLAEAAVRMMERNMRAEITDSVQCLNI
ncbi:hypothetical protein AB0O34_08375 [Sphaerisporangium sp. NPDC088356]|uniref:hypothetical protein n=1 Tax=Sphaerisporangium sp. NPDC088356 TaxID=3154871 RepID=UPI0034309321